uniref:Cytochrome c oxidase assembly factor 5 n=1 Tax=Felis catus TaxID=9685 RepID=A0ABI7W4M2_FELCA
MNLRGSLVQLSYTDEETEVPCPGLFPICCFIGADIQPALSKRLEGKSPRQCLKEGNCKALKYSFFECKRSMLDARSRFRGRKGY